ncbi:hypothetical protein FRC18_006001, partial [Serendipita sp. 400]
MSMRTQVWTPTARGIKGATVFRFANSPHPSHFSSSSLLCLFQVIPRPFLSPNHSSTMPSFTFKSLLVFASLASLPAALASPVTPDIVPRATSCTIKTYTDAINLSSCTSITIAAQTVPAGQSLNVTGLKDGTTVTLSGDISFGTGVHWTGTLFTLSGGKISFNGNGHTINGNGAYYWDGQGTNGGVDKPKYTVALKHSGTFTNVKVINVPGHAFSVQNPAALTVSSVTYDNSAGKSLGHNTDGFDVSHSTDLTITGCTVINQDDCVAINSGTNVKFLNNSCTGGHGISIGSIKTGNVVNGVTISGNKVINNSNGQAAPFVFLQKIAHLWIGLRIKTYADNNNASVSNVIYKDNTVTGATDYGVIIVQDY